MSKRTLLLSFSCLLFLSLAPAQKFRSGLFLHHSTGLTIWGPNGSSTSVPDEIAAYNAAHGFTGANACSLNEVWWPDVTGDNEWATWHQIFYDQNPDQNIHPILDTNNIVIIKSCFPSSNISDIGADADTLDPTLKTISNYKWHWRYILRAMQARPQNFFVIWTNAPLVAGSTNNQEAPLSDWFCRWAKDTLALGLDPGFGAFPRNVYVFDFFHKLAGPDGKLPRGYASGSTDSHPNGTATAIVAPQFVREVFDAAIGYEAGRPMPDTVNGWYFHSAENASFDTAYSRMSRDRIQGFSSQVFGYAINNLGGEPGVDYRGLVWEKQLPSLLVTPDSVRLYLKNGASGNPALSFEVVHGDTVASLGEWTVSSTSWDEQSASTSGITAKPALFDRVRLRIEFTSAPFAGSGEIFIDSIAIASGSGVWTDLEMFEQPPIPIISPTVINFGTVAIGCRETESVDIARGDASPFSLTIGSVVSTNPAFQITPQAAVLPDSTAHTSFIVTFAPSDTGAKSGAIIFTHDGEGFADTVLVSGQATGLGTESSIQIIESGWQLLSPSLRPLTCPHILPGSFEYTNGYRRQDTLEVGKGYWYKIGVWPAAFIGEPVPRESVQVLARWNLVGGLSFPIPVDRIRMVAPDSIRSYFFKYTGSGYRIADTLSPGRGYWVKVKEEGVMILDIAIAPFAFPSTVPKANPSSLYNALSFTDAAGRTQTLYVSTSAVKASALEQYELPPLPPAGCFDVRFANGKCLASVGDAKIALSAVSYPLTVRWEGRDGSERSEGSEGSDVVLIADGIEIRIPVKGTALITSPVSHLSLRVAQNAKHAAPTEFSLGQNYPNPFNPATTISYQLPAESKVLLRVFNLLGQEIARLADEVQQAGYRQLPWDAGNLPSGIYFCRLEAAFIADPGKMFLGVRKIVLTR